MEERTGGAYWTSGAFLRRTPRRKAPPESPGRNTPGIPPGRFRSPATGSTRLLRLRPEVREGVMADRRLWRGGCAPESRSHSNKHPLDEGTGRRTVRTRTPPYPSERTHRRRPLSLGARSRPRDGRAGGRGGVSAASLPRAGVRRPRPARPPRRGCGFRAPRRRRRRDARIGPAGGARNADLLTGRRLFRYVG